MRWRVWHRTGLGIGLGISLGIVIPAVQIYSYSHQTHSSSADVAIVLGAAVWQGKPSPVFQERINHAITLYQTQQIQTLILTGGIGAGDRLAESEVARDYAVHQGVPITQIAIETRSRMTQENLREAQQIMQQQGWQTALIVSDPLHMKRAMTMATDLDLQAYPSPTPTSRYRSWPAQARFLKREVFFLRLYQIRKLLAS